MIKDKTCNTCIDNDDGFCDRKGILVEDEDTCELHRESWRQQLIERFMRVE